MLSNYGKTSAKGDNTILHSLQIKSINGLNFTAYWTKNWLTPAKDCYAQSFLDILSGRMFLLFFADAQQG
jgi:hypothetical protein